MSGGSNAGEQQHLWRIDRSTRKNDLFVDTNLLLHPIFEVRDTNGACTLKEDTAGQGLRLQGQIGTTECWMQIPYGCTMTPPLLLRHLIFAEPLLRSTVKIVIFGPA